MSVPKDADARKFYRVARQRLEEAKLIAEKLQLWTAAEHIGGYVVRWAGGRMVLDEYEYLHPGAVVTVYRQNSASVRIRIVDTRFEGTSLGQRHDDVWKFIADRLSEDDAEEVSVLLLLAPSEQQKTFMNFEFDDPIPSTL